MNSTGDTIMAGNFSARVMEVKKENGEGSSGSPIITSRPPIPPYNPGEEIRQMPACRLFPLCLILSLALPSSIVFAADAPLTVGEHLRDTVLESPHPYPAGHGSTAKPVWSDHFHYPGASYLVFEFEKWDLVEVRDPDRKQVHIYEGRGYKEKGGDFVSKMILGDEAYIDLYSAGIRNEHYGYRIGRITRGFSDAEMAAATSWGPEAICGTDDKEDAVCYETTFPDVYDKARAVVRIVMDGSSLCTGWLVSCQNHLITNNHCTWDDDDFDTQGELDRMEFQFMYQDSTCGGGGATFEYSFMGGTWLENDHDLDYTLIQAPVGQNPAATYGWLLIDYRLAVPDELMYIVGHPSGRPKEISLYSTDPTDQDNPDGFCEVFATDRPVCVGGSVPEIGYYCDTEGGNSGSPVLARDTDKVIALHHCANCPNRGVRIQNIWDTNQAGASPLPACSLYDDSGFVGMDQPTYGCSDTITIAVNDGSLVGAGTQPVTIWSGTESLEEVVVLIESPPVSGSFVGTIATTSSAAVNGDGLLSVADGDPITLRYIDADDGQGGVNVPREAVAVADCTGPVISGVAVTDLEGTRATVTWSTDEPADSEVFYSDAPPAWATSGSMDRVTEHSVPLTGLTECTPYSFGVRSTDLAENTTTDDAAGQYHTFTTAARLQSLYNSTDTPLAVTDLGNTVSTVSVAETKAVVDVDVTVNISHPYDGDLDIYLTGPNGTEIELSTDNGGSGDDYTGTVFDDEANASITTGSPPFTGSFRPEESLSVFDGVSATGDWELRVFDDASGVGGTLDSWTLTLTLPPPSCGPNPIYASHSVTGDDCPSGGAGDGDGIWDGGEEVSFHVDVRNDGTEPVTGVLATVTSLTPGVVLTQDTSAYGDMTAGAVGGSLTPFTTLLTEALPCGAAAEFRIDVVANEGAWSSTFEQEVGEFPVAAGAVLDEDFDAGIPGTWTIVDGGASTATWFADNPADPGACGNTDPSPPIGGGWAAADSDCAEENDMDEQLITPVLDLSAATMVTLEFDHYLNHYLAATGDVDVRSSLTGGGWVNVARWTTDTANPSHEIIDLTAQAAGAANVQIRWHYYDANFDWYWYVDNALVSVTQPGPCSQAPCISGGAPPGEQSGLHYVDASTLSWGLDAGATGGYAVYRGTGPELPAILTGATDSCSVFGTSDPFENSADMTGEGSPPPGGIYWYVATGWNAVGEGPPGDATAGPRVVDSVGACP